MPNHSPAPWTVAGQSEAGRYISIKDAKGRTVARVMWNREGTPLHETTDADDATLISSAPELLAALHLCRPVVADALNGVLESACLRDPETLEPRRDTLDPEEADYVATLEAVLAQVDAAVANAEAR